MRLTKTKTMISAALFAAALTVLAACSDELSDAAVKATDGGRVTLCLDVSVPSGSDAITVTNGTRATEGASEGIDNALNGVFAVFAFDAEDKLMWTALSDDTNTDTNLKGEGNYKDFTKSPSITWHSDGEGTGTGRLYIEADEYEGEMSLFVITNIDNLVENFDEYFSKMELGEDAAKTDVIDALSVFNFYVTDDDMEEMEYIPMTGDVTLADGVTLGSTGKLGLRRSLAKVTFNFVWNDEYYTSKSLADCNGDITNLREESGLKVFIPDSLEVAYVSDLAAVYSPSDAINIPEEAKKISRYIKVPAVVYNEADTTFSTSVSFYVPETRNSKQNAMSGMTIVDDPRTSFILSGMFYEIESSVGGITTTADDDDDSGDGDDVNDHFEAFYRLDLIPATGSYEELDSIVRNTSYTFDIENVSKRGSTNRDYALGENMPDNIRMEAVTDMAFIGIDDDDILSVTADYSNYATTYVNGDSIKTPLYIGVSATTVYMPRTQNAVERIKVITNAASGYMAEDNGWTIDISLLPSNGNPETSSIADTGVAFSFIYDEDAECLWIWLDHPELLTVGQTYVYYITAGNIRKKMRIVITEGEYNDDDSTGDDTGGD